MVNVLQQAVEYINFYFLLDWKTSKSNKENPSLLNMNSIASGGIQCTLGTMTEH